MVTVRARNRLVRWRAKLDLKMWLEGNLCGSTSERVRADTCFAVAIKGENKNVAAVHSSSPHVDSNVCQALEPRGRAIASSLAGATLYHAPGVRILQ